MKPLVLIGGGGHCKSVIEAAESQGRTILGVLDLPERVGDAILSTNVIGIDDDISDYITKADFVVTVGFVKNPSTRIRLFNKVKNTGGRLASIIASSANVSKYATMGEGTVVMHHAFVNAGARIGDNVIINTFANIEHDVVIGAHSHISTGAMVNGCAHIGQSCFIGSQVVIANNVIVADDVIIGAGAVVTKNIEESGVYVGNPARLLH